MTFLEQLQSHKGGLLRLKTELYWYDGRGWDKNPDRICLLLDTAAAAAAATTIAAAAAATTTYLLIDGTCSWVWMTKEDVELL